MNYLTSEHTCPNCKNKLVYYISEGYYSKGKKIFSCEVCGWKPESKKEVLCENGCDGITTRCSDCPNPN